jgi:branched-subunit amino acid transport protein
MIATGLLTFAMRFVMFSGLAPKKLPAMFEEALAFVPIAVLSAIIVPAVLLDSTQSLSFVDNARVPAALIAIATALLTRSVVLTITAGLAALWFLLFLGY